MFKQTKCLALLAVPMLLLAIPAQAALKVFACEPEWGALTQELGGDLVDVAVATKAMLRGSVCMCGLPAACTSPCERSSCVGTSSLCT